MIWILSTETLLLLLLLFFYIIIKKQPVIQYSWGILTIFSFLILNLNVNDRTRSYVLIKGAWAYCEETCNGELPNQKAPENIASSAFNSLWDSRIFHFKPWEAGHCHTYSPNETFLPNTPGHFYGFLGDKALNLSVLEFYGYDVYLHSSKVSCRNIKNKLNFVTLNF